MSRNRTTTCPPAPAGSARRDVRRALLAGCSVAALLIGTAVAGASPATAVDWTSAPLPARVAVGAPPLVPGGLTALGSVAAATVLHLDVALRPRDPEAVNAFVTAVSTPSSPLYRHFLKKGQFGPRFGATPATIAMVAAALRHDGMTVGPVSANDLLLPVTTTVARAEATFDVAIHAYRTSSGTVFDANSSAPTLPGAVGSDVLSVVGLDGLPLLAGQDLRGTSSTTSARTAKREDVTHAITSSVPGAPVACKDATKLGFFTAPQIAKAYDFTPLYAEGDFGLGQSVDLFEIGTFSQTDINTYQSCYGTHATPQVTKVDGGATITSGPPANEADADVEDLIGLAPEAFIQVYETPNSWTGIVDGYDQIADNDDTKVVSTSVGFCEPLALASGIAPLEVFQFAQMASQGESVFSAAGDDGSEGCWATPALAPPGTQLAVDDPASQPDVTGVGGTTLDEVNAPPLYPPAEVTWDQTGINPGSGGGGISSIWAMPPWQTGPGVVEDYSSGAPCSASAGYCREVPDVSADAGAGYSVAISGVWQGFQGTSLAAPTWAALTALINASTATCDVNGLGLLNPSLYALAAAPPGSADFNDITTGDNDYLSDHGGRYPAGVGYDMATGLGSPVGALLAQSLCPRTVVPVRIGGTQNYWTAPPKLTTTYSLPPGVTISGTLSCPPSPSVDGRTLITLSLAAGSYTVDGENCTGLKVSDPEMYVLEYSGITDGFVVTKENTTLSLATSPATEVYGDESPATFSIKVTTAHGSALQFDALTSVDAGATPVCLAVVDTNVGGGSGSCHPVSETVLPAGRYNPSTFYGGNVDMNSAGPSSTSFTVSKDETTMSLSVSPSTVPFDLESEAVFTVRVTTAHGEQLPETDAVTVDVGSTRCVADVAPAPGGGSGSCTIIGNALAPGSYTASASYSGDSDLDASGPSTRVFTVTGP
jgi:hypothetical protein